VRLGTAIAFELVVAGGAIGGVAFGVSRARELATEYLAEREAAAATMPDGGPIASPHESAAPTLPETIPPRRDDSVYGARDADLLAPIRGALARVKTNRGGTSLSFRLDFASGARASFKPLQIHPQSDPRREIAAYRIDRMLGIGHVPPAKSIAFPVADVIAVADADLRQLVISRLEDEAIIQDGMLRGEASWWIPEIKVARLGPHELDSPEGMALWRSYLQPNATYPAELRDYLAQIATVVVFDVLIDNADRWSGSNARVSPDRKILYFMDNTLSFSAYTKGHNTNLGPMRAIGVFPRALVEKIRTLDYDSLARTLAGPDDGGLGPLLTPIEIRAILARRDHVVEHVDDLIARFGEAAVLALP